MRVVCTEEGYIILEDPFHYLEKPLRASSSSLSRCWWSAKKLCCIAKSSYLTPLCTALYPLGRFTILVGEICKQEALILHPRMSNFGLRRLWTASRHNDHRKFILWQGAKFVSWLLGPMMNWKMSVPKKVPKISPKNCYGLPVMHNDIFLEQKCSFMQHYFLPKYKC